MSRGASQHLRQIHHQHQNEKQKQNFIIGPDKKDCSLPSKEKSFRKTDAAVAGVREKSGTSESSDFVRTSLIVGCMEAIRRFLNMDSLSMGVLAAAAEAAGTLCVLSLSLMHIYTHTHAHKHTHTYTHTQYTPHA